MLARCRSLIALIGASALVALVPSVASAHRRFGAPGHCHVVIASIAPRLVTAGESTEISGRLVCAHATDAGQAVELFAEPARSSSFTAIQTTTTEAEGAYKFTTTPEQANTVFYASSDGAQSQHKRLLVAASVTLTGPPEGTLQTRAPETFSGTVTPADAGARVVLQREDAASSEQWHWIGAAQVAANGSYTIPHSFRIPGDASIRVLMRSDGLNVPSPSNILQYQISQAQNPQLTISASADPITYGQSVTIAGTLAGASSPQTVELYGHTLNQHGWAQIAEVQTQTGGAYSFPAQMPLNNTYYEVRAATQKSAILFEDVGALLSAEASPTTIQAGQAVTFTGTVAPEASGHSIYLEVQNSSGSGFHVVQVGHVLTGSSYSIVHQFYVPGTKTVRIEFPGGPANGRAISQTFAISVTPAPAGALQPESPNNTSLPGEGQTQGTGEPAFSEEELEGTSVNPHGKPTRRGHDK